MTRLRVTLTVTILAMLGILFNSNTSFAAGETLKYHERTSYQYKMSCSMAPSDVEQLLYVNCKKKRKRSQSDEEILQSPERARNFLAKSNREFVTNYNLFMEECCMEGCRMEEILEHCIVSN